MPVVARFALIDRPFDDDLRGHELLGYLRIVAARGPAMLSNTVVRRYGTASMDRLSFRAARLQRASVMALAVYPNDAGIPSLTAVPAATCTRRTYRFL
jgi:hypothetical protein